MPIDLPRVFVLRRDRGCRISSIVLRYGVAMTLSDARDGQDTIGVFDILRSKILSGELPAGTRLNEKALSDSIGASRGSIREALRRLEEREMVTSRPNAGARVTVHTPEDVIESYFIREALEGLAARLAATRITPQELEQIRRAIDERTEMHSIIVQASRNKRLISQLGERHFDLLRKLRMDFPHMHTAGPDSFFEHEMIYHALKIGDPVLSETVMRQHISRLRMSVSRKFAADERTARE
ncbi:GntR family transcriptional regulator [Salipiger profundus]|uniref:GntR family transcriptional regulator n=1 Tax=Salipiger profundus TaxID=1229727 RepID=UPI000B830A8F|nr:GntR family transcriptional regulator [Salipiger profundus]